MWLVALESTTQSLRGMGGVKLKEPAREGGSHALNHGGKGGHSCGGA
jgi:hypothetical protein